MDPICLHNYSLDDKKSEWSDEEKQKLDVTYTFASFWTASTAARQAIFDQKWSDNGQLKSAAGDTFPVVSGDDSVSYTHLDVYKRQELQRVI